jgi:hypothetical protein
MGALPSAGIAPHVAECAGQIGGETHLDVVSSSSEPPVGFEPTTFALQDQKEA